MHLESRNLNENKIEMEALNKDVHLLGHVVIRLMTRAHELNIFLRGTHFFLNLTWTKWYINVLILINLRILTS